MDSSCSILSEALKDAIETAAEIMKDNNQPPYVRLRAAEIIFDHSNNYIRVKDFQYRLKTEASKAVNEEIVNFLYDNRE